MSNSSHPVGDPLAIFGGTFDPVHYGHLRCAEETRSKLGLETVYLLPSGTPPHRNEPQASTPQRMEMLRLALGEFPALGIDDRETRRSGPSYMVDTLMELKAEHPERPILLLLGQDVANDLHTWHEWERLFDFTHIVVLTRPGSTAEYRQDVAKKIDRRTCADAQSLLESQSGGVLYLGVTSVDVSATMIKSIIRLGRSPGSMMPQVVWEYINKNHLYLPV